MCLKNLKRSRKKEIIGYCVMKKIGEDLYNGCYYRHRDDFMKPKVRYTAKPMNGEDNYYGFHGFSDLDTAKQYFFRQRGNYKRLKIVLVKCRFNNILSYGVAPPFYKSFKAKYKTILEEVKI